MGRKSTINLLPADVKSYIEGKLAEGRLSLEGLIADLRQRFPEHGEAGNLPSKSAMQRYGQKLERRLSMIKASTEAARMICAQAGDDEDSRSEALTALVQSELFEALLSIQEADDTEMDPAERVAVLSSAAKNIATLTRSSIGLKQFQRDVRQRAKEAAAAIEKIAVKGGLSAEAVALIKTEVMGVAA